MKSTDHPEAQSFILRNVSCASFLISLLLVFCLAVYHARAIAFLGAIFVALTLVAWWLIPYLSKRGLSTGWFLSIAIVNILLVVPELSLRIMDFRYEAGIQFGYPREIGFRKFKTNETLFWTYNPSEAGINSWGFREREILPNDKPANVTRVLFLGDSCTEQGLPHIAEVMLNGNAAMQHFECISLSISGYSSFQGRKIADLYGEAVKPDIVVVYYGWNDHWQAYGSTDSNKQLPNSISFLDRMRHFLSNSRLFQFLQYVATSFRTKTIGPLPYARVSPDEYEDNLASIYKIFSRMNATVIFITAPTSHYTLGLPDYIVKMKFIPDNKSSIRRHQQYNNIVRKVQKEYSLSVLCDLEAMYLKIPPERLKKVFLIDGIHFSESGLALLAHDVCTTIRQISRKGQ